MNDQDLFNELFEAVKKDKLAEVEQYLAKGYPIDGTYQKSSYYYDYGLTVLHAAKSAAMAELFIEKGANVNAVVSLEDARCKGYTPLHKASEEGFSEVVAVLLKHSAVVDEKIEDNDYESGYTALHLICKKSGSLYSNNKADKEKNKVQTAKLLLEYGANVNAAIVGNSKKSMACFSGFTPLHLTKSSKLTELLIQYGGEVDAHNEDGLTPLQIACKNRLNDVMEVLRASEVIKVLLAHHADPNVIYPDGQRPLDLICICNEPQLMLTFLQHGAQLCQDSELTARIRSLQSCTLEQLKEFINIYFELFVLLLKLDDLKHNKENVFLFWFSEVNLNLREEISELYPKRRRKDEYSYKLVSAIDELDRHGENILLCLDSKIEDPFKNELLLTFKALITLKEVLSEIPYENKKTGLYYHYFSNTKDIISWLAEDKYHDYFYNDSVNNYWLLILAALHYFSPPSTLFGASGDRLCSSRSTEDLIIQKIYSVISESLIQLTQLQTEKFNTIQKMHQLRENSHTKIRNWELNQQEQLRQEVVELRSQLEQSKNELPDQSSINDRAIAAYLDLRKREGAVGNDNRIVRETNIQELKPLTQLDSNSKLDGNSFCITL